MSVRKVGSARLVPNNKKELIVQMAVELEVIRSGGSTISRVGFPKLHRWMQQELGLELDNGPLEDILCSTSVLQEA